MSFKTITAVVAVLSLTACGSGTTPNEPKVEPRTQLFGDLSDLINAGTTPEGAIDNGPGIKTDLPNNTKITYVGIGAIAPVYADDFPVEDIITFTGTASIELDFTTSNGTLSGKVTNLREESIKDGVNLPKDIYGDVDFAGKSADEINEYFEITNTFDGEIELSGMALLDGNLTASYKSTLTPTQGDAYPIVLEDTLLGGVLNTDDKNGLLGLVSKYDHYTTDPQDVVSGSMTSTNAAYNFSEIETVIFAK